MPMMPLTIHGMQALEVLSGLQKFIRRGMEREAMRCAIELMHSSKAYHTMLCNRLEVISHEDIGIAVPHVVPFVHAAMNQARLWYSPDIKHRKSELPVSNSILLLCRSQKSREADHFAGLHCWASILDDEKPEIPEWSMDKHTRKGRRLGRGIEYFREVSAQLSPAPAAPDRYEDEAYAMWKRVEASNSTPDELPLADEAE